MASQGTVHQQLRTYQLARDMASSSRVSLSKCSAGIIDAVMSGVDALLRLLSHSGQKRWAALALLCCCRNPPAAAAPATVVQATTGSAAACEGLVTSFERLKVGATGGAHQQPEADIRPTAAPASLPSQEEPPTIDLGALSGGPGHLSLAAVRGLHSAMND